MDWKYIIPIFLAIVFFVVSTILAMKLARRKKPAWAYSTRHIIGRDAEAPPELKYVFGTREVKDVYKTTLIFFNMGNENIRGDLADVSDINDNIVFHFRGAEILRQPIIQKPSKEAIKFSAKQIVKDSDNAIELHFRYLGHNDGAIVEIWHTKCDQIFPSGDIMNVDITQLKEFVRSRPEGFYVSLAVPIFFLALFLWLLGNEIAKGTGLGDYVGLLVLVAIIIASSAYGMPRLFRYRAFPGWSRIKGLRTE